MRVFQSLGDLALHLLEREAVLLEEMHHGLKAAAVLIEKTAREELGSYQPDVGPFPSWPELADATKERRGAAGYTENDPLLASGAMRDSLGHEVDGLEATIGSRDEKAPYHEFGTERMPARPFLGPAAFRNKETIRRLVGAAALSGLIGRDRVHEALGYDFTTGE